MVSAGVTELEEMVKEADAGFLIRKSPAFEKHIRQLEELAQIVERMGKRVNKWQF